MTPIAKLALLLLLTVRSLSGWSLCGQAIDQPRQHRVTLSLNGTWDVDDSVASNAIPTIYRHTAPVPGLAHSATPLFPNVDRYESSQLLFNLARSGRIPKSDYEKLGDLRGISLQQRNYFWYRRFFQAPGKHAVALLKISKAQFGTVVFLNGERIGEHDPCFTSATFNVTNSIRWGARNEVVIRIGAHPGVLPANVSQGTDFEKNRWTPGIYDDVSLAVMDNPVIASVQVAPQLATSSILVETELHNDSSREITTTLYQQVYEKKSQSPASHLIRTQVRIPPHSAQSVRQQVPLTKSHLWSPENPFLYLISSYTAGDSVSTRFGMREFRFDTVTQRAYLNGRPYFLRGSNIALHRFFEDPKSGTLPWNEAWLQRLLVDIPKQLHWNSFRFSIGPVPDRWLEIADEAGLLIENEYMVWTGYPGPMTWTSHYDNAEMIAEYGEWIRDNWNHPSVVIWDASNESLLPEFTDRIIPAVRGLDLSNRPWENSYNAPAGPDDPVEDHQYLFQSEATEDKPKHPFQMEDLQNMEGPGLNHSTSKTAHSMILNEYGWLWLNRDGSPTSLTEKLYPKLLQGANTTTNRVELQSYLLQGETEFWRSSRHYAGVLHFVYLTSSEPNAFTSDNFSDVRMLELEPHFATAMEQAFNPLGVYLNFWQPSLALNELRYYTVEMVNDEDMPQRGTLELQFVAADGSVASETERAFALDRLGADSYSIALKAPAVAGKYSLRAVALEQGRDQHPVASTRHVAVSAEAKRGN